MLELVARFILDALRQEIEEARALEIHEAVKEPEPAQ